LTRYDEAIASYDRRLAVKSDLPIACAIAATPLMELGRFDDAFGDL